MEDFFLDGGAFQLKDALRQNLHQITTNAIGFQKLGGASTMIPFRRLVCWDRRGRLKMTVQAGCCAVSKALLLFFLAHSFVISLRAQSPDDKPVSEAAVSLARPCSSVAADSKSKDKGKPKSAANRTPSGSACLEAKGSLVDLHEFFQSYVRQQGWRIDDERMAEDSWIFSRYLNKDQLLQFAKEGTYAGRVRWTEGKAVVQITAHELDGGFTRVEVSARFQGEGQNLDRFAPPRDTWDLDSTGALEKSLMAALEAHLKSVH